MIFFFEFPVILILFVVLGLLGMDISFISGIIKWIMIISGVIAILYGICIRLDAWDNKEKIASVLTIIFGVVLIILAFVLYNYIKSLGSFSLYDILNWIL